ncbi:MAG: DUF3606 domain-containing protein [Variovorax sp.]|nr:MAG: DUF3606 domain-containing protein [Variovorax sp.]
MSNPRVDTPVATSPQPTTFINVREPDDVRQWSDRFGVTESQLRLAIADVGDAAIQVGEYLGMPQAPRYA